MNPPSSSVPAWTELLRVHSYDVDFTRRLTVTSLCRYFLEAAWNHAEALGVGFKQLAHEGRFWVLSRLRLELIRPPAWGSAITLRTWPRGARAVFALRDFELTDEVGVRLAAGTSAWLVLDTARRPQRLLKLMPALAGLDGPAALGCEPEKLPQFEGTGDGFTVPVRHTDIDVNRHVNSSRYVGWMLDGYPGEFHAAHDLRVLEVNYLDEAREGDLLNACAHSAGALTFCHSLTKAGGSEVCRARLAWTAGTPAVAT